MGWDCICGSSIGYGGHYCEGMQRVVAQRQLDLLTDIANSLRKDTPARPHWRKFDIDDIGDGRASEAMAR